MLPEKQAMRVEEVTTTPAYHDSIVGHLTTDVILWLQIDEFIKTGTFAALAEADNAVEGGDADKKGEAVESKAKVAGKDMAMKFL